MRPAEQTHSHSFFYLFLFPRLTKAIEKGKLVNAQTRQHELATKKAHSAKVKVGMKLAKARDGNKVSKVANTLPKQRTANLNKSKTGKQLARIKTANKSLTARNTSPKRNKENGKA